MNKAPYSGIAKHLAAYGRYGDTELVHMNPVEVKILESLSPTGQLTNNPQTGQKEAFLPFLAPILGSFLGSAALGGTMTGVLGSAALGQAAAGAIGSALATTAVTGDVEQGMMSGITGFGLGSALGAMGAGASAGAGAGAADALGGAGASLATETINPSLMSGVGSDVFAQELAKGAVDPSLITRASTAASNTFSPGISGLAGTTAPSSAQGIASGAGGVFDQAAMSGSDPGMMGGIRSVFNNPKGYVDALSRPESFMPIYMGETARQARADEMADANSARGFKKEEERKRRKVLGDISGIYDRIRTAYPQVGY